MPPFLEWVLLNTIPFLAVLGLVVTIHELGHFLAAKACGAAVDRFAIGFGRPIVTWTDRSGVEWRVGWIPLGGYVRFSGDENAASVPDQDDLETLRRHVVAREGEGGLNRYFHFKPVWQRAIIVAAGPVANFLLAVGIFAVLLMSLGEMVLPARVGQVAPGSPAAAAGFRPGDLIVRADGRKISNFNELQHIVRVRANVPMVFEVRREGREVLLQVTPRSRMLDDPVTGPQAGGAIGVTPPQGPGDYIQVRYGPIEAVVGAVERSYKVLDTTVYYLGRLVTGQITGEQLRGPLGIASATGKIAELSTQGAESASAMWTRLVLNLAQLAALISLSVGFMNLLPIPILDGGHLLFYAYEAVARRPLAAKVQAAGYRVGLALVLGLMLFATWNDLQRLRVLNLFGGLFS